MDAQAIRNGVPERKLTAWHNPTKTAQTVIIRDGQPFAFTVGPGETKELDSRYDFVVHQRDCGKDECHRRGWFCRGEHDGLVVGGSAPLLQRVGHKDRLDASLDPDYQSKKAIHEEIDREVEREKILAQARARIASGATDDARPSAQSASSGAQAKK